jgi:hypothetical protein
MKKFLDSKRWKQVFSGFEIVDVAIRDKVTLQMVTRQSVTSGKASRSSDSEIATRIVSLFTEMPAGNNCGFQELSGMPFPVVGVSRAPFVRPSGMVTAMNKDGDTWPVGGGNGPMEQIAKGKWPGTQKLKCINGFTYSVGSGRSLYKRIEVGNWVSFKVGFPSTNADIWPGFENMATAKQLELTGSLGFNDLDAFGDSDMYAVGGHGDVWHYDGKKWTQMGFPSNVELGTVTCGGDGNVYISGEGGSLWVGQKSTWKSIYKGSSSILWNDVLWFEGKLWLSSDYQFRIWNGKDLEAVMHDGKAVPMNGHMDAYDGLLAIASSEYVMTYDGKAWKTIVAPYLD